MPHFLADPHMSKLSDEEYLVLRAKETSASNPYQSKAWTVTAKTLFPQNFDIQFEAYLIEKNNGNAKEAAKCFSTLFQSFVSENGLWEEIHALTNALRSEDMSPEAVFLRNMFSFNPPIIQHDILTVTAEKSEDTMEHCRLRLLLFKKFPQTTPQLIIRLVETLMTAEKHGHCPSVINCYRKTLVCEVLPLLLHMTADLPSKQLYRFLHKSIEFYLVYLMSKPSAVENLFDQENKTDISWESFFNLLKMFAAKLDWEICRINSIFASPWNRDAVWQQILSFDSVRMVPDLGKAVKQQVYCLTILFVYCLYQYNITLNPISDTRNAAVLVEAFVKPSEEVLSLPPKKLKVDPSVVDPNLPVLTAGEETGDIIRHFNFTLKCWNMLNSTDVNQKEFLKLKQHIRLDAWLLDFLTDVALYRNKIEEFQVHTQSTVNTIRSSLQKLTFNYVMKNYHMLGECSIPIIRQIDSLTTVGNYYPSLTESGVSRHLHYLPITKIPVLQYVVKLLIIMYWQLLSNYTGFDIDRVYGSLLILCQMSWPSEKRIVFDILTRIRAQRTFTFPLFFKYVVNIEILEEFMHMYANEQETVKLDLMGSSQTLSAKRMSTRGVDKGEREDFRLMMKQQVCRQEPLYTLIIQFLLEEERYISTK